MTELERMIRVHRVRDRMLVEGRVYTPLANESFDMIVGSYGIRFSTTILSVYDETAIVRELDYADESKRTIDSVLLCESADIVSGRVDSEISLREVIRGRVHTSYNIVGTDTLRMSAKNPPLQTVSKATNDN